MTGVSLWMGDRTRHVFEDIITTGTIITYVSSHLHPLRHALTIVVSRIHHLVPHQTISQWHAAAIAP